MRSVKKGPFVSCRLIKKVNNRNKTKHKKEGVINTWSRASTIIPSMIGHTLSVHNGASLIPVFITDQIVGYKLGEFAGTRTYTKPTKSN